MIGLSRKYGNNMGSRNWYCILFLFLVTHLRFQTDGSESMWIGFALGDGGHVRSRGLPPLRHGNLPPYQVRGNCSSWCDWRILASSWGPLRGRWVCWPRAPSTCGPGGPGATETSTNSQRYELQLIETCGDTWRSPDCDAGTIKNEEVHLCNRS